jgi:signal peptidase I
LGSRTGFKDGRDERETKPKSLFAEYAETILICSLILVFSRTFVVQQSEIPSSSMEDTILVGDYILVNRFLYAPTSFDIERALLPTREVRRGDVLVFGKQDLPEVDYIKRAVGLPGDTVQLRDGFLYVNDQLVDEPYVGELYHKAANFGPVTVKPGHYFMLGDHRNMSADSRVWGQLPQELIKGRAFMILFSTSARPPDDEQPGRVTFISLFRKLYNLGFHARWDRTFRSIR